MVTQALRDRVRQLSHTDRLDLIGELWESLETDQIQITDGERELLDDRLEDRQGNPEAGRSWDAIEAELRASR